MVYIVAFLLQQRKGSLVKRKCTNNSLVLEYAMQKQAWSFTALRAILTTVCSYHWLMLIKWMIWTVWGNWVHNKSTWSLRGNLRLERRSLFNWTWVCSSPEYIFCGFFGYKLVAKLGQVVMVRCKLKAHGTFLLHGDRLVVELLCYLIEILGPFRSPPCLVQLSPVTRRTTPFALFILHGYEPLRAFFANTYLVYASRAFNGLMLLEPGTGISCL